MTYIFISRLYGLGALTLLAVLVGCNSPNDERALDDKSFSSKDLTTNVRIKRVGISNFLYFIESNGKVISQRDRVFFTENGTVLEKLNITGGMSVSKGATLAQFDKSSILFKLERSRLKFFNAQMEYQSQLLGYENILKGLTSRETDEIKKKIMISTGLSDIRQDLLELNDQLKKTTIVAPFDGVIADIKVQEGQMLKPGDELFRLYDPNYLSLESKVLESEFPLLKEGNKAKIIPINDKSKFYNAAISEINPLVDNNGMVTIKLKIKRKNHEQIFPGLNCTVSIIIKGKKSLLVPKEAIVLRNGKNVVFTISGNLAKWNYVLLGKDNGESVEIIAGLNNGQKIIVDNNMTLVDNSLIKVIY